ncbi:Uncharacterised protein [Segatella copri]|nr:Uncharacterised protein [Segatella copri]
MSLMNLVSITLSISITNTLLWAIISRISMTIITVILISMQLVMQRLLLSRVCLTVLNLTVR